MGSIRDDIDAIQAVTRLHNETDNRVAAWHLSLWVYGHIVEAAAPYDLLANLIHVAKGGEAGMVPFALESGRLYSPGRKLEVIGDGAGDSVIRGSSSSSCRDLAPAASQRRWFHADYTIHGSRNPSGRRRG